MSKEGTETKSTESLINESHQSSLKSLEYLINESHLTALQHGWWDEDEPRTIEDLLALVTSEVSEALEEFRKSGVSNDDVHKLIELRTPEWYKFL